MSEDPKEELILEGSTDIILMDNEGVSVIDSDAFYNSKNEPLLLPRVIRKQIPYNEYYMKTRRKDSKPNILPLNTRFVKHYPTAGNWSLLVVEDEPQLRTIRTSHNVRDEINLLKSKEYWKAYGLEGMDAKGKKYDIDDYRDTNQNPFTFRLSFPFISYVMAFREEQFQGMYVFFRLSPITSLSDYVLYAPLHNIPEEQLICLGRWKNDLRPQPKNLFEEATAAIDTFWGARFNNDYRFNYQKYFDNPELSSYFSWQYHTQQDPMFIFKTKWVQIGTVDQMIKKMESRLNLYNQEHSSPFSYDRMWETLMNRTITADIDPVITPEPQPIIGNRISNFTNSIFLGETSLSVGDEIEYSKIKYVVDDFLGIQGSNNPTHIKVSEIDNPENVAELEYTSSLKTSINKQLAGERSKKSVELPLSKEKVKVGDFITYLDTRLNKEVYRKIESIRLGLDKKNHIAFTGAQGHYFADLLNAKPVDVSNGIKIPGTDIILKEKESYLSIGKDGSHPGCAEVSILRNIKIQKIDIINGSLGITYEQDYFGRNSTTIENIDESIGKIVSANYLEKLVEVKFPYMRVGAVIVRLPNNYIQKMYIDPDTLKLHVQYTNQGEGYRNFNDLVVSDENRLDLSRLLSEENRRLNIPGHDFDIDLKVGDKVFVGDWSRGTIEPFKLRTIESFVINRERGTLSVVTRDNVGNLLDTPYIATNRFIKIGLIRKAVTEYKGVKRGDVIKCKVKGLVDFPMVAKNTVLGIMIDSAAEPMIVCSNGCTLWYSDIRNFTKIDYNEVNETTFTAENIKKFVPSAGNLYSNNERFYPYIIMEFVNNTNDLGALNANKSSRLKLYNYMSSASVCNGSEADIKYYSPYPLGLPVPRLGGTEYVSKNLHFAVPSLHGGYIRVGSGRWGARIQKFLN